MLTVAAKGVRRQVFSCLLTLSLLIAACGSENGATPVGSTTTAASAAADLTVEKVLGWINDSFEGAPLACSESGPVKVGGIFACGGPPSNSESTLVEYGGTVVYVIDESGRAAWTSGTDVPGPTKDLLRSYNEVPKGLFCRDLLSPETYAFPFSGNGDNPKSAFFWSLVYWSLEGKPERMDADLDGIPCETLYDTVVIDDVLAGGPAGE